MKKVTGRTVAWTSSIEDKDMKQAVAYASFALLCAGCATPDQLRQNEAQSAEQAYALKTLRSGLESQVADQRKDITQTQESMRGLEVAVAQAVARADAAKIQADSAQAASKEFLANLIAAREEQRRQLDENGAAFAELRRKSADLDAKLQAQQRAMEQGVAASNELMRRLIAVENGLQETARRSALLEAKTGTMQESDARLAQQLSALGKQVAETRALVGSEGLLQLMRQVEDVRRDSALLRGSIEELQKAQTGSTAQLKNFYLDLDTRIRLMKQNTSQQVRQSPAAEQPSPAIPAQDAGSSPQSVPGQPPNQ
jgi:hypothetical protein